MKDHAFILKNTKAVNEMWMEWIGERRQQSSWMMLMNDDDLKDLRLWAGRIWIISVDQVIGESSIVTKAKLDFLSFYENLLKLENFQSQKFKTLHTSNEMSKYSIDVT